METQIQQLKLNVTNIKSYLTSSNSQIKTLRKQKRNLIGKLEQQSEVRAKESKIESRSFGIGSAVSNITSAVTAPAKNIFDRILEFFGLIALGVLVQKLPAIIAKIEEFFNSDFVKTIQFLVDGLVKTVETFVFLVKVFNGAERKRLEDKQKMLSGALDSVGKTFDAISKLFTNASDPGSPSSPMPLTPDGASPPSLPAKPGPPSGNGGPLGGPIPRQKPEQKPEQKLSSGGTVKSGDGNSEGVAPPVQTPRRSGRLNYAIRSSETGFLGFSLAANNLMDVANAQQKNVSNFEDMTKNFKEWSYLNEGGKKPPSPDPDPGTGGGTKKIGSALLPPPPSGVGDKIINFYGGQGRDPGQPGVDFSYGNYKGNYSLFDGEVIEKGTLYGSAYGNVVVVRSTDPSNGKLFDALYAHFPNGGTSVSVGQKIVAGTYLGKSGFAGRVGRGGRAVMQGNGAGNMSGYHTSVDFYEPGSSAPYSNYRYLQDLVIKGANKDVTSLLKGSGGGNRLNTISKTKNIGSTGGGETNIVFVPYEIQTPFPYPVPIETTSSSPAPSRKKLPEIWRP